MKQRTILLVCLLSAFMAVLISFPARAQDGGLAVASNEALVDFPEKVTFRLELLPDTPIREATLNYKLGGSNCLEASTQVPVEIDGSTLEWVWVMSRSGNPPPGASLEWFWTVTDSSGEVKSTPPERLTFSDDRFDWTTIKTEVPPGQPQISLSWYAGEEVGPILLDAAAAGLERLQQDTGIELQGDVQIFIYGDSEDMREALLYVQDWAGGVAFAEYNTILIGVPPYLADTWGSSTVRHELAHLIIGQYARSCLGGSLPTWLSEGLAVYAEGEPDEQTLADIDAGIEDDQFEPVRSLNGAFPAQDDRAGQAYSQSYSLVAFLLDNYGQEKIQLLLQTLAAGEGYDAALEQIYGFNSDGLELAWRAAIGANPRPIPSTPTPITGASIPTAVPLAGAQNWPTPLPVGEPGSGPTPEATGAPATPDSSVPLCSFGLIPAMLVLGWSVSARKRRIT